MKLSFLSVFVLVGTVLAAVFGLGDAPGQTWYKITTAFLLAAGLYASTYGIDINEARRHKRIILSAVTFGVVLKALIIGVTLALVFRNPYYAVLGVVVAQIDPLSVSVLMRGTRLSSRAKTILASWSSFDDPVTVILSLYAPLVVSHVAGVSLPGLGVSSGSPGALSYVIELGTSFLYVACVFGLWQVIKRYAVRGKSNSLAYAFIACGLAVAAYRFWMLGVALMGLFVRPDIGRFIDLAVTWALRLAAVLLGMLLLGGVDVVPGLALGFMAFTAQVVVGLLLTGGLPRRDRVHIAFAQQNGITAIILALLFEPVYPGTAGIVAPAILTVNALYIFANWLIDRQAKLTSPETEAAGVNQKSPARLDRAAGNLWCV